MPIPWPPYEPGKHGRPTLFGPEVERVRFASLPEHPAPYDDEAGIELDAEADDDHTSLDDDAFFRSLRQAVLEPSDDDDEPGDRPAR